MANEINYTYSTTGATLYVIITNNTGKRWDNVNDTWDSFINADIADYAIALSEDPAVSYRYDGDFPAAIGAGAYNVEIFLQATAVPLVSDIKLATASMEWDGDIELTPATGFCTLEELKRYLGLDQLETSSDVYLQEIIDGIVSRVQKYCGRDFTSIEYTEVRTIDNNVMLMDNFPITAIDSITDADGNVWVYEEDYDYYNDDLDKGQITVLRYPNRWAGTCTRAKYTFVYQAGYSPIPEDLRLLVRQIAGTIFNTSQNSAALDSENINGFRLVDTYRLNSDHLRLLDRYRKLD